MGKILIIRGGALGDFILTLPAIRLLRETYPDNHVEILGYKPFGDLAVKGGLADAVRSIEYGAMAGFFAPGSALNPELIDYFRSFDLVISYLYDPDGYLRGNLEKAGVKTLMEGIYKVDESGLHAAHQLAATLEQLALYLEDPGARLLDHKPTKGRLRIALHPGSGSPKKNWSVENWLEVAVRINGEFPGAEFVLVTGEVEEEHVHGIATQWKDSGVIFSQAHNLPLWTLAETLAECSLFLGHDSGVSHLAAAVGLPAVLLFGPTNPDIWAPGNPQVTVVRSEDYSLTGLRVDEVHQSVTKKLRSLTCQ
jgi:heptosyltransferase-3